MIAAAAGPLEMAGALALVLGVVIALFTVAEKITGLGERWLSRGVESGTRPLREDVNDMKVQARELHVALEELERYSRHHMGPNGDSEPLHKQVKAIQVSLGETKNEQARGGDR